MPRIIVVGAGIIGSAITYNLAIRGADVLLLDQGAGAGTGVTGNAFGWINLAGGTPGERSYAFRRDAIDEYRQLIEALPSAFSSVRRGSLFWKATERETAEFALLHQKAGEQVELLDKDALHALEPNLRQPPKFAALLPDDLALDPRQLAQHLVRAARNAGARLRFHAAISAVDTEGGNVTGVRIGDEKLTANVVILAAGAGVQRLTNDLGIDTGIAISPALLMRYSCDRPLINHILCGPRLEIRQTVGGQLLVAEDCNTDTSHQMLQLVGQQTLSIMTEELLLPEGVKLESAEVGQRPIFSDGLPRVGFLPQLGNLYLAVGHPGVILAALIGRVVADQVLFGRSIGVVDYLCRLPPK